MILTPFQHRDLDGTFSRLLGSAILEYRDPNDGQSADPERKRRHQYTLLDGVPLSRVLPPAELGDSDTGKLSRRPPSWESLGHSTQWPLLNDWVEYVLGDAPRPWSMGGSIAYGDSFHSRNAISMTWMRSVIEIRGLHAWPQQIPCPHCHDWIVWAEAGYAPGYRICRGCHRHWRAERTNAGWMLRRARGHGWPYSS